MKTQTMKKVLIALDYNPTAQKVAEVGYSLANTLGAEITLLHVVYDPVYYSTTGYSPIMGFSGYLDLNPFQMNTIERVMEESYNFLEKTKRHLGDETIKTLVKEGDYADTIAKTAKDMHADIIVMGSHSQKWLENILIGSVTEKVLHHTTIPLFIIPTKKDNE